MLISATGNSGIARPDAERAGFTLVELLVVLVVVGLMTGVVVLIMPDKISGAEADARRFAARLVLAAEESVISGDTIGVMITRDGYAFRRLYRGQWRAAGSNSPFGAKGREKDRAIDMRWGDGVLVLFERNGQPVVLAAGLPPDNNENAALNGLAPTLLLDPLGMVTPFRLVIHDDEGRFAVTAGPDGLIEVVNELEG